MDIPRQDRKARSREPITAKLVANLIETAGATRMIALDFTCTTNSRILLIFQLTT